MNHFPYDAVLFDLDGTLFSAEAGILSSMEYAMEQLGYPIPPDVDLRSMIGPPLRDTLTTLLRLPPEAVEEAVAVYGKRFMEEGIRRYTMYPQIRLLLQTLRKGGVYTAVVTSKRRSVALSVLERFGLTRYFDRVVGPEEDELGADKVLLVRRGLPEKARRAAMVGDRCFDMRGAVANGIDGIGAGYGYGSDEELRDAGATHIVPDTEALMALLCQGAEIPRGFFLTVEGLDGSGKSTQTDLLEKNLRDYGFSVLRTREPGGCEISEDIRRIILDPNNMEMCPACEALLYAAARAQHVHQVIRPAVERGVLVLCDRFADSSVAYQGSGRELGMDTVQQINAPAVSDMQPDATVYLAIDHRIGLQRRLLASAPDRLEMEGAAFLERVQKAYEKLIHDNRRRFLVVNGEQEVEAVARDALDAVLSRLEPDMKREG